MRDVIVWVLILTGPRPYPIDTFPDQRGCQQAKYDYGRGFSATDKSNRPRNKLVCRWQVKSVPRTVDIP